MKRKAFLLGGLILLMNIRSQNPMPYWGNGGMWVTYIFASSSPTDLVNGYYISIMKDTMVNNTPYLTYYCKNAPYNDDDFCPFYNKLFRVGNNNKVYVDSILVGPSTYTNLLIYDFTPNSKGDSTDYIQLMMNFPGGPTIKKLKVDSIWYESNGNRNLKFVYLTYDYYTPTLWIEGIGSVFGFRNYLFEVLSPAYIYYYGACYSYNDTIYYLNIPPYQRSTTISSWLWPWIGTLVRIPGRCDTISYFKGKWLNMPEYGGKNMIDVHPVPTWNDIFVSSYVIIERIKICSIHGVLMNQWEINASSKDLSISDLPAGFYIMEIYLKNGSVVKKKIIKQ